MHTFSVILGFLSIIFFSIVYFFDFGLLKRLDPRGLTSFAAGIGIVYVFIHMLPQLAHGQYLLEAEFINTHFLSNPLSIYLIALIGFIFFYFLDRILTYTTELPTEDYTSRAEAYIYWTNIIFFTIYNMMIGYVVGSYNLDNIGYQLIYLLAYMIHFIAIKWGIYHISAEKYNKKARYPIIIGLFVGYFIALFFNFPEYIFAIIEALVTGAMILAVVKHELPREQDNKGQAFILGIILSTLLFVFV